MRGLGAALVLVLGSQREPGGRLDYLPGEAGVLYVSAARVLQRDRRLQTYDSKIKGILLTQSTFTCLFPSTMPYLGSV